MKNFTLLIALFFSLIITAQDDPGKRPELLLGKEVTIIDLTGNYYSDISKEKGYQRFYIDKEVLSTYKKNSKHNTEYEALFNKTFTVKNVELKEESQYGGGPYHVITLESPDLVLYHKYYDKRAYYFKVKGGLEYPDDFYCDYIIEKPFQDTGLVDYIIEPYSGLNLTKTKGKELTAYLLYVGIVGDKTLDKSKGISVTLDNGAKIERPDFVPQIGVNSYGDYRYSGVIELTAKEIELLKAHVITGSQIGANKRNEYSEDKIKKSLPCLLTK